MTIAIAADQFTIGIGKDVPAMGPFKSYSPRLAGRGGGIVQGAYTLGRHVYRHYRKYTKLGSAIAGAGVAQYAKNSSSYNYRQTLRTKNKYKSSFRSRAPKQNCKCCCQHIVASRGYRRKRRQYY